METIGIKFQVYQQREPKAIAKHPTIKGVYLYAPNIVELGTVVADNAAEAIKKLKQASIFKHGKGLAAFPIVAVFKEKKQNKDGK